LPSGNFIPETETENNYWAGEANGETIQILAGIQRDTDENWWKNHPEWINMGPQGALLVVPDSNWQKKILIATPTRNGYVHFLTECEALLVLQATDKTIFTFDPAKLEFVPNNDACLIPE
jgi:hypothetical protein